MIENKRFESHDNIILDAEGKSLKSIDEIVDVLNELDSENDFLYDNIIKFEKENEQLKIIRSDLASELDIVQNELNIAIDKGFAPSQPYINYMASKKTEYDKFWENKIKTHNNLLKEFRE